MYLLWIAAFSSILAVAPAWADSLSCAVFRDRLNGALLASGQKVDALDFKQAFTNPARGTRFDWTGNNLAGELSCGPTDQFEEFVIELRIQKRDGLADAFKRLLTVEGASFCALADATATACTEYGRTMLEGAMSQMGAAFNHGVRQPSGLSERVMSGPLRATLTCAPTLITFVIGPGRGDSVDAARQPLPAPPASPPG